MRVSILGDELLERDGAALLEVHEVHDHGVVLQGEGREEGLVLTRCRYAVQLVRFAALMFVAELDRVSRLVLRLVQVPNLEFFVLVDREELTQACGESGVLVSEVLDALDVLLVLFLDVDVIKIKEAPLDLGNGIDGLVVPDCNRRREVLVEESTNIWLQIFYLLTRSSRRSMPPAGSLCRSSKEPLENSILGFPFLSEPHPAAACPF